MKRMTAHDEHSKKVVNNIKHYLELLREGSFAKDYPHAAAIGMIEGLMNLKMSGSDKLEEIQKVLAALEQFEGNED